MAPSTNKRPPPLDGVAAVGVSLRRCLGVPRQAFWQAIVVWIERKYHRQRPQDSLDGLTPIEHETRITTNAAPAA